MYLLLGRTLLSIILIQTLALGPRTPVLAYYLTTSYLYKRVYFNILSGNSDTYRFLNQSKASWLLHLCPKMRLPLHSLSTDIGTGAGFPFWC